MAKKRTETGMNVLIELGTVEKATRLAQVLSLIHGHRVTRPYAVDKAIADALKRADETLASMTKEPARE